MEAQRSEYEAEQSTCIQPSINMAAHGAVRSRTRMLPCDCFLLGPIGHGWLTGGGQLCLRRRRKTAYHGDGDGNGNHLRHGIHHVTQHQQTRLGGSSEIYRILAKG